MFRSTPLLIRFYSVRPGSPPHNMVAKDGHFFELINGASLVKRCPSRRARPPFSAHAYQHPQDPTQWPLWMESDCASDYESSDDELTQEELDELDAKDGRGHLRPNQVSVWSIDYSLRTCGGISAPRVGTTYTD